MARMNISVPDDLRAQMDQHDHTNWSSVAQRAFEQHLIHLKSRMETTTMEDVIERLRASKQANEEEEKKSGHEAGRQWAMKFAEYHQLERVVEIDWEGVDSLDQVPHHVLAMAAMADDEAGYHDVENFWKETVGVRIPTGVLISAFQDGVLEVWQEVSTKI